MTQDIPFFQSDSNNWSSEEVIKQHEYTFITTDLRNNTVLAELPLQNVSYGTVLSGTGEASGAVRVNNDTVVLKLREVTMPSRTGLYIIRDDRVMWGGIIWKRNYNSKNRELRLSCKTFESYFYKRLQLTTKAWDDADQLDIARWLVTSNQSAKALDIDVSTAMSGELRDRVMFGYEFKTTGLELEQLAALEGGFDWNVNVYQNSDYTIGRKLDFYYPAAGISRQETELFFEHPGAIDEFTLSEDGENAGNSVWSIGAGEGTEQVRANATDAGALANNWPLLEISRSYKSVVRPSTLQRHADADIERLRAPVAVFEVTVRPDIDPVLGTYQLGDWARFRMEDDFLYPAFDTYARITGIDVSLDNSTGLETVSLTLGGGEISTGE